MLPILIVFMAHAFSPPLVEPAPIQGVVNAPVAPDTIYVWRQTGASGLSVVDLNGFGQGTGNPAFDFSYSTFTEGNTNFPNNPNLKLQGSVLVPQLFPGVTTRDGGSAGVFTLTKNDQLSDVLLAAPHVGSIVDMMLGQPLDLVYNNGVSTCQVGGSVCSETGLQLNAPAAGGGHTLSPSQLGGTPIQLGQGLGNSISWAPHPNPPRLLSQPVCSMPLIAGQEPTSIKSLLELGLANLLLPGNPLSIPPTGLLAKEQNGFFVGPSPAQSLPTCLQYSVRQQIGHFLYLADSANEEVVVVNSNRMTVLDRISVPGPGEFAMSPNLDYLAVTSRSTGSVYFIDIQPDSSTFHRVVKVTQVGGRPLGIAWDPGNEDILVCNEGTNSVSIVSAFNLEVRKVLRRGLDRPFAVAITQRQEGFGFERNVYFAYILDRSGKVSLFESGPNGVNGWGYDEIIGRTPFVLHNARAMQPDPLRLSSGVWIVHDLQVGADGQPTGLGGGAVTNLVLLSNAVGPLPLTAADLSTPSMRSLRWSVALSIGSDQLTGIPTDIAFDDQRNLGGLTNVASQFSSGVPALQNGKSQVRKWNASIASTTAPALMFVPVNDSASLTQRIDVLDLATGLRTDTNGYQPGIQSIPAHGASRIMNYFRQ